MKKALAFFLLILLVAILPAAPSRAEVHDLGATVTLTPAVPPPGQKGSIAVVLLEANGTPVGGARIRASLGPMDEPAPEPLLLQEGPTGRYTAPLAFPNTVAAIIRLDVELSGQRWQANLPIRMGAEWFRVSGLPLELQQLDASGKPMPEPLPPGVTLPEPTPAPSTTTPGATQSTQATTPTRPPFWKMTITLVALMSVAGLVLRRPKTRR